MQEKECADTHANYSYKLNEHGSTLQPPLRFTITMIVGVLRNDHAPNMRTS